LPAPSPLAAQNGEALSPETFLQTGHSDSIYDIAWSPDGRRIVSGSYDNTVKVWDAESGRELRTIPVDDSLYSAQFSPDGGRIIRGSFDNTVNIFDAATGREIRSLAGHGNWGASVSYSPDGRRILSG
jgi:WD40 repeat protein